MTFFTSRSEPHVVEFLNVLTPKLLSLKTCTSTIIIRSNKCVFFKSVFNQLGGKSELFFLSSLNPNWPLFIGPKRVCDFWNLKIKVDSALSGTVPRSNSEKMQKHNLSGTAQNGKNLQTRENYLLLIHNQRCADPTSIIIPHYPGHFYKQKVCKWWKFVQ